MSHETCRFGTRNLPLKAPESQRDGAWGQKTSKNKQHGEPFMLSSERFGLQELINPPCPTRQHWKKFSATFTESKTKCNFYWVWSMWGTFPSLHLTCETPAVMGRGCAAAGMTPLGSHHLFIIEHAGIRETAGYYFYLRFDISGCEANFRVQKPEITP